MHPMSKNFKIWGKQQKYTGSEFTCCQANIWIKIPSSHTHKKIKIALLKAETPMMFCDFYFKYVLVISLVTGKKISELFRTHLKVILKQETKAFP